MGKMARTKKMRYEVNTKTEDMQSVRSTNDEKVISNNCKILNTRNRTLKAIRLLQRSQKCLICLRPFTRIVKFIGSRGRDTMIIKRKAIIILREVSECYLRCILEDANLICI